MTTALTAVGMVVGAILFGLYCVGVMVNFLDRVDEERPLVVCVVLALCWPVHSWVVYERKRRVC